MKKIGVIIASGVLVCATVAGFLFATKPWENHSSEESQMAENDNKGNKSEDKKDDKETKDSQGSELSDPILEWWELYNPNGFNTFTGVISNPNNIAVDVTYDLVYYKNGEEVVRRGRLIDNIEGQRFGTLTEIKRAANRITPMGNAKTCWECICDCGDVVIKDRAYLRTHKNDTLQFQLNLIDHTWLPLYQYLIILTMLCGILSMFAKKIYTR